jgi:hypothetical protein
MQDRKCLSSFCVPDLGMEAWVLPPSGSAGLHTRTGVAGLYAVGITARGDEAAHTATASGHVQASPDAAVVVASRPAHRQTFPMGPVESSRESLIITWSGLPPGDEVRLSGTNVNTALSTSWLLRRYKEIALAFLQICGWTQRRIMQYMILLTSLSFCVPDHTSEVIRLTLFNGIHFYYESNGAGETLTFLHGAGGNHCYSSSGPRTRFCRQRLSMRSSTPSQARGSANSAPAVIPFTGRTPPSLTVRLMRSWPSISEWGHMKGGRQRNR